MSKQPELRTVFVDFCKFADKKNNGTMDNKKFSKFCKDTKILSKTLFTNDADLTFQAVKTKGTRQINFEQFHEAVKRLAMKRFKDISKQEAYDKLVTIILKHAKPSTANGTRAEKVKFHDDKSTYTGVFGRTGGPPTTIDKDKISLSSLADRSDQNIRGVQKHVVEFVKENYDPNKTQHTIKDAYSHGNPPVCKHCNGTGLAL